MKAFFKYFFAALLALIVFVGIGFLLLFGVAGVIASSEKPAIAEKSVLFIDLSKQFKERKTDNTLARLSGDGDVLATSLYDVVRLLKHAKTDSLIKGVYLKCNDNANGFAASEELRNAILEFRESKKFVIAYGDVISQRAYFIASAADEIYCNPKGMVDWKGFSSQLFFIKNTLEKLDIEPQIFYDGKFKSATEPLREEKMTDANRLQTTVWLGDIYQRFLLGVSAARNIDTATLHRYASDFMIQTAHDAVEYQLVDAVKYDDEVKDEIRQRLKIDSDETIPFVPVGTYAEATRLNKYASDRIAVIYAEGDIVYGKGREGQVGSDEFRKLLAKARTDKNIKAVVLRVNSPGGDALASEIIWRETMLTRKAGKPLVVSMGDLAASGGYYISCAADSIFAQPNTITGSIGVFGVVPNLQDFFKNKLGVTFDQVKTAPYADLQTTFRPLTPGEKRIIQASVDTVYHDFKLRVAEGRNKDMQLVDSIAQGRVWTGSRALQIGLVDRLGGLDNAIACAASMAKLKEYSLREYPEPASFWDMLKSGYNNSVKMRIIKEELGSPNFMLYEQWQRVRQMIGKVQTRLPYDIIVD